MHYGIQTVGCSGKPEGIAHVAPSLHPDGSPQGSELYNGAFGVVHHWVEGIFVFFQLLVLSWFFAGLWLVGNEEVTKSLYLKEAFVSLLAFGQSGIPFGGSASFWLGVGSVFSSLENHSALFDADDSAVDFAGRGGIAHDAPVALHLLRRFGDLAIHRFEHPMVAYQLPVVNSCEHGTSLTVAHGHGSFWGVFGFWRWACCCMPCGMLILRLGTNDGLWASFWLLNLKLTLMLGLSVIPIGALQWMEAIGRDYASACSLAFYEQLFVHLFNKLRLPGNAKIIFGALLLAEVVLKAVVFQRPFLVTTKAQ